MSVLDIMSAIGSVVVIVLVLVLTYYASRWYARRMGGGPGGVRGGGQGRYVKVLERTNLGQSSSIMIVEVAQKYYLIGVSDKNIQMLCELEDFAQQLTQDPPPADAPFSQVLRGFLNKNRQSGKNGDDGRA